MRIMAAKAINTAAANPAANGFSPTFFMALKLVLRPTPEMAKAMQYPAIVLTIFTVVFMLAASMI